jgi:ubiquinone/menaquinone biosynthesis C-methylase UbiE
MTVTPNPQRFFTERYDAYDRFIRTGLYPQGLRAFFLASPLLRPGLRVLDAGCGTGAVTVALREALVRRGFSAQSFNAFDLTPAMLDRFREVLQRRAIENVALAQANVLNLATLPSSWLDYDLVVTASMMEYVPRVQFVDALKGLRARLADDGTLVLFITRRNPLTHLLIGRWWQSNLYTTRELADAFRATGFSHFAFRRFPFRACYLSLWGYVVEAKR